MYIDFYQTDGTACFYRVQFSEYSFIITFNIQEIVLHTEKTMYRVFMTRSDYPVEAEELLREKFEVIKSTEPHIITKEALLREVKGVHAIFCISTDVIDKEVLDVAGPQLKIVSTMSVGFDNIDIKECNKRNIIVTHVPHISTDAVAEFTVGLLLAVSRKIVEGYLTVLRGEWNEQWHPDFCCGRSLKNSTVGIVGMGRIGQGVLKRVLPFGVARVLYYDVVHPIEKAEKLGACYVPFEELLKESDYIIANCVLSDDTKGMFNSRAFSLMKHTAVFINTSRGGVVQQDDLYNALKTGQIRAAGIDVMTPEPLPKDDKLISLPNIVISPHIASAEKAVIEGQAKLNAKNILAVLDGKSPITPVVL